MILLLELFAGPDESGHPARCDVRGSRRLSEQRPTEHIFLVSLLRGSQDVKSLSCQGLLRYACCLVQRPLVDPSQGDPSLWLLGVD